MGISPQSISLELAGLATNVNFLEIPMYYVVIILKVWNASEHI